MRTVAGRRAEAGELSPEHRATVNPSKPLRKSLVQDHFEIDDRNFSLLGPLRQDANLSRDVHDWFNIIVLLPLCALNFANWSVSADSIQQVLEGTLAVPSLWSGHHFEFFFWLTVMYFVTDALWVTIVPNCVRSPGVILKHHAATLVYMTIPFFYEEYSWLMGACMSVEVNTWFLIARRLFNKQGVVPFTFTAAMPGGTVEVKIISIFFYLTWIVIRLLIYPVLLFITWNAYMERWLRVGSPFNAITVAPLLQLVLVCFNVKWSFDLFHSKMRSLGPSQGL